MAADLDRELEGLDRYLRSRAIPEGLESERARLLLERAKERGREVQDEISRGQSLQHGHGLMNAVARGQHPVMAFETGRRQVASASSAEFANRLRLRYLEQILPTLRAEAKKNEVVPPAE